MWKSGKLTFQIATLSPLNVTLLEGLGGGGRGGEGGSPRDMFLGGLVWIEKSALDDFRGAMSLLRVLPTDRRFLTQPAYLPLFLPPRIYLSRK